MQEFDDIHVQFVELEQQRYDTAGDYYIRGGTLHILITKEYYQTTDPYATAYNKVVRNRLLEFSYLVHELVEVLLVIARGIPIESIDDFDMNYKGDDPGSDPKAPYHHEHMFATKVHQMMERQLGLKPL